MIQKITGFFIGFMFIAIFSNAQHVTCGYDFVMKNIQKDKAYADDVNSVFHEAKNDNTLDRFEEVYKIPITFHVVWKDSLENIDDSLFYQQIDVLNKNYRRLNANADEVRSEFVDIVSDPKIEFELKEIIRVKTDTTFDVDLFGGGLADYVKQTSEGGSDAVDVETNLNVWVCDLKKFSIFGQEGKLLGYSYPPAGLPHWPSDFKAPSPELDGVVLDFRVVGKNNPYEVKIPGFGDVNTEGKTLVHEIGHYLGLRHTWGDAQVPLQDGCQFDDGVDDTPNCYQQAMFDCNHDKNSCDQSDMDDKPDMVENFMDYSEETCMNSFTIGQISIMRGVLRNVRCKLVGNCEHVANSDIQQLNLLKLSPNPAHDQVVVIGDVGVNPISVAIYNTLGRLISKSPLIGETINVSNLAEGLYFFEFQMNENIITKKVLIR